MSWFEIQIGELGRIVTGKTPPTKNRSFFQGLYQFVTPSDLSFRNYYCRSTEVSVTEEARNKFKNQVVPQDAIMFTCIGNTIGKCGISYEPCLTNQQINSIIPSRQYDPKFVYYLMLHNVEKVRAIGIGGGSATPIVNKTLFSKILVKVPSRQEQSQIGKLLSAYDDLIENNRRRIHLLEQSARLLYKEWFVRLRFPGHERVKIKNGVPEGWERKPLSAICSDIRDAVKPDQVEPNTPYIGLEHIPRRSITLNHWGCAEDVESTKFRFAEGDILFGKIRPYFHKVGIALTEGITSSDSIVIRANAKRLTPYCLALVSSDQFVAVASKTAKEGSKMPRADWKFMEQHPILLPTHSVLLGFNRFFDDILKQVKLLALQGKKLANARDLLLPRLMNGEIAV